jgi:tetratricopeptide (TPR) repeat protein
MVGFVQATAITVCSEDCDYQSLQSAVYAAKPNDTIEVHSSIYNESVVLTKNVDFKGIDTGSGEPVVNGGLYKNGHTSSLRGFSFQEVSPQIKYSYKMAIPNTTIYWIENASEVGKESPTKGLSIINSVIKTNPNDAYAWFIKGCILHDGQRYEDAIDAYNESLRLDPYSATTWNNIGASLSFLKKYNESLQAYDKAIEIYPNHELAWRNKGDSFLVKLRKYDEAIKAYDKAIEINPQDAVAWNNKGLSLYKLGKYDEAIKAYDKAIENDPQDKLTWNNKGYALKLLGHTVEAEAAFAQAKELEDTD